MKAAWYDTLGPAASVLQYGQSTDASAVANSALAPDEVRVKLVTSGVNPSDVKSRASRPMIAPRIIPHSDGAGVIDAVGENVSSTRIGERVWIWNGQWKRPFGTAAEYITLPAIQAVALPDHIDFAAGACLGIPALTALRALTIDGGVTGRTVLVAGGTGAVGAYAIQFARLLGAARILTTVSSPEKAQIAKDLGADDVIDYRRESVVDRVLLATQGRGVDRVVEVDAHANIAWLPDVVTQDGLVVVYGSGKPEISVSFPAMIMKGIAVRFFIVYELLPDDRRDMVQALTRYLHANLLVHPIAATFPLSDIVAAHLAVESGKMIGNVIVDVTR